MTELAEEGLSVGTLRLQKAALDMTHTSTGQPDPTDNEGITRLMAGITRTHGRPQRQVKPLTAPALTSVKATATIPRRYQGHAVRGVVRRSERPISLTRRLREWILDVKLAYPSQLRVDLATEASSQLPSHVL